MKNSLIVLSATSALALCALPATAQSGGNFQITRSTIDGGGALRSAGGNFTLSGTVGQPDATVARGGVFTLQGGFWGGITLIQTPGAPMLKIQRVPPSRAVISWPVSVTGFALEEAPTVNGPWTPAQGLAAATATEQTVTINSTIGMKLYRLKQQATPARGGQ